jgi:hypothetical protein
MSEDETSPPLTLFAEDSPARTSASQESGPASAESEAGYGRNTSESFASYDPATSSWRTSQHSLFGGLTSFSESWPRSGMTRNGIAYRRPASAPLTDVIDFSSLPTPSASQGGFNRSPSPGAAVRPSLETMARHGMWPTPRANDAEKRGDIANDPRNGLPAAAKYWPTPRAEDSEQTGAHHDKADTLTSAVRLFPTPQARDWKDGTNPQPRGRHSESLPVVVGGGRLNPTWVEWLMGFPIGHSVLEHWVTRSSRRSPK